MKKVLITGSEGFIGKHLIDEMLANGYEVIKCSRDGGNGFVAMNILDASQVKDVIQTHCPDILINMAGQANVALSWKIPALTVSLNVNGLVNILEAVRQIKPDMRIVAVGSSDEYGSLEERGVNVTEDIPIHPMTPYAISKVAQEEMAQAYNRAYGMDICMIRCFNLGGAYQPKGYMISDFASGIAEIEAGKKGYLSVGNLDSARDFTHVKDAACACRLIAEYGKTGEVYNISSGVTYTAQQVLDKLVEMANCEIIIKQDPQRMRPSDTPVVCGNHDKLTSHTGWMPRYSLHNILADALYYWEQEIKR